MEQKLLFEVNRIRQMMGLKSLLIEGPSSICPFCSEFFSQISKILDQAAKLGDDVNVTKQLEDIRAKIDGSGLNSSEKNILNKILDDSIENYKLSKNITKLQDDIKLKIENEGLSKVTQPEVIVKNIIDTDAIIKDINFATELFDSGAKHQTYKTEIEANLDTVIEFANKNKKSDVSLKDATIAELDSFIREKYATDGLDPELINNLMVKWKEWFETLDKIKSMDLGQITRTTPSNVLDKMDDKYSNKYFEIIKKTGDDLTEGELVFKKLVEDWKSGKEVTNEEFEAALKKIGQTNKKTVEDLTTITKDKYNKILEKEKTGIVLTDYEKNLKSDVEKFLNGENINLKDYDFPKTYIDNLKKFIKKYIKYNKKYSQLIRDMVYSLDNTKYIESDIKNTFPQFENGILPEEIKKTITDDPNLKNFFTNLEGKKYGWQVDSEGKWIPTNMLDGNTGDKTTFFRDILEEVMNKEGKKIDEFMTFNEQEQNRLLNETLKHIENSKNTLKNKLLESERYIKNSQRTIIRGDEGEEIAKNAFIKNNFEIVWQGGKGNALDKLGVDMIVKKDGKHYLVSVKTISGEFRTYPSYITGKNLIGFFQPSKINIDTGFAAYVDKNNKLIIIPPQDRINKETGEKIGEGFRKDVGWTQIEDDSVLIKNF